MTKLLLDEHPLQVLPGLAKKIGLNEAIFLQQIHYWNEINKKANNNYRDGYHWTFNSGKDFLEQFPFWSKKTIQRTITRLEKLKLLVSGNYNKLKIDRTKWYRIDYKVLSALESSPFTQIGSTNESKWVEHLASLGLPLPEINSEISSEINKKHKGTENDSVRVAFSFQDYIKKFKVNEVDIEVIEHYLSLYRDCMNEEHPNLKAEQWGYVVDRLYYVTNPDYDIDFDLDESAVMDMMEKHFQTEYENCDYNILHFMSDGVRVKRMYEVAY
ncbi:hypothetical protein [Bacillus sp. CHD6a]|uniref:hypothetical protein n=1 Tax=Bacillus sp. CHD6a TaxID=1643452 RepID=UPI0007610586|nr:hypothetical protein [Bacillus sp. CHD6a]